MHRLETSFAELLETSDDQLADLVAFGLNPVARFAAAVEAAKALRHDPLGSDFSDAIEQPPSIADYVVDIEHALARGLLEHRSEQSFSLLDRVAAQVVAVNAEQVEREIGEPVRLPAGNRIVDQIQMRDAALVGHGDLAVEHQLAARGCQLVEWRSK